LILQTLDIKNNCKGLFYKNKLIEDPKEEILQSCKYAWKHSSILTKHNYEYLYLYLKSEELEKFSKDIDDYSNIKKTITAQQKAARIASIDIGDQCFFNILPDFQIKNWFEQRQWALEKLLKCLDRPPEYDILHKAHILCESLAKRNLFYKGETKKVKYNIFGSVTGRLTTKKGSVPILTMKRQDRQDLKPNNDAFLELDFNAAEIRTLIALSGKEQPETDIHSWVSQSVYDGKLPREKVKTKLFAWLYNSSASENELSKFFSRQIFRDFYCTETSTLETPYMRKIKVEERKAQNYLLQSTTSDIVLENAYKIMNILNGKQSQISFLLHDSVVIDFSRQDLPMIKELKSIFEKTKWGTFMSNCKIGKNFGTMRELKL
jgi:hypothetical protein